MAGSNRMGEGGKRENGWMNENVNEKEQKEQRVNENQKREETEAQDGILVCVLCVAREGR